MSYKSNMNTLWAKILHHKDILDRNQTKILNYNFENYIDQAILSALSQKTNFEYEILVGDDSSTDKSYMNIERYAYTPSVTIIKYPINLGGQMNIKTLIEKSKFP